MRGHSSVRSRLEDGGVIEPACVHDYEFLRTEYEMTEGAWRSSFKQVDVFYCRKCLEHRCKIVRETTDHKRPTWFKP